MKTLLSLGFIVFCIANSYAQPNNVVTAYMELQEGKLEDAKKKIDAASEHEKTKGQAKTWYFRGKIYMAIYSDMISSGKEYGMKPENVLLEASNSYKKASGMDTERIDANQLDREYQITANYLLNEGVSFYNDKSYEIAVTLFKQTINVQKDFGIVDSLAMYNVGLASEKAGDISEAIEYYLKCARMGYNSDAAFYFAVTLYKDQGNTNDVLELIEEGLSVNPRNTNLLITKINILLSIEDVKGALSTMDQALVEMPRNADMNFSRGTLLEASDLKEAMKSYERSIEINPNHVNALYNLGAAYYNHAVDLRNSEDATQDTALEELKMSRKYLERVEALSPGNEAVQSSLTVIRDILQD
jgi:tetratricopeptide (TPR) repeat protein